MMLGTTNIKLNVCRIHMCYDLQPFDSEVYIAVGNIIHLPPPTYSDNQIHLNKSCIQQTIFSNFKISHLDLS